METYHRTVPVPGGDLFAAQWGTGTPVLAVHGLSANHRTWPPMVRHLGDDVHVVAADLRGRGGSAALSGPFGMSTHAADMIAILDALDIDQALVVGHSMGAFVAATMAVEHPGRVSGLVLVDGGFTAPLPVGADPDAVLEAVVGPALARLDMTFESLDAYRDFWRAHPAFRSNWSTDVEQYLAWDLDAGEPLRSRAAKAAVMYDGRDLLANDEVRAAVTRAQVPITLLRAPRGLLDQPEPLISAELLDTFRPAMPHLRDRVVPDCNHYTILLGRGAPTVAAEVRAALRG